jgi:hypothetical protein
MKIYLLLSIGIALTTAIPVYSGIQHDSGLLPDSIIKNRNTFSSHFSWELQLGSCFLTNTSLSANRPLVTSKTLSGSFFTSITIPFTKKETEHPAHVATHIGIGTTIQTFGLNKIIEDMGTTTTFIDFPNDNIRYSYLQQIFIAAPISLSYRPFLNHGLELEFGGIAGYQVYREHTVYTTEKQGYSIRSTEHINNLQPFQYGILGKINFIRSRTGRPFGCMYSVSGNYYISKLFKVVNNTPTNTFSLFVGIGFFIHR